MSTDHVKKAVSFVEEVVEGWMLGDLERMISKIEALPNSAGNCNFPIALYIFSCMEFLGFLTSHKEINDNERGNTKKRIWAYIELTFNKEYQNELRPYEDIFVTIFRNGLAHEYFAKAAGISRKGNLLISVNSNGNMILDADKLYEAFNNSTSKLKEKIKDNSNNVAAILIDRYNRKQNNLKGKFLQTTPSPILTPTTNTSGASIAPPTHTTTLPH